MSHKDDIKDTKGTEKPTEKKTPEPQAPEGKPTREPEYTTADPDSNISGGQHNVTQKTREALRKQKHVTISIPSTETQKDDVTVTLNGYNYLFKRDEEAPVPVDVVGVLEHAEMTVYTQVARENGEGFEMVPSKALRFPFRTYVE